MIQRKNPGDLRKPIVANVLIVIEHGMLTTYYADQNVKLTLIDLDGRDQDERATLDDCTYDMIPDDIIENVEGAVGWYASRFTEAN